MDFTQYLSGNTLSIKQVDLTNQDIRALISFLQKHQEITKFDLMFCKVSNKDIKDIIESLDSKSLKELNLSYNKIGTENVTNIFNFKKFINLEKLNLGHNELSNKDLKMLNDFENLTNIKELDLSENNIDDDGVEIIAKNFKSLIVLNLGSNKISDKGAKYIAEKFKKLREINLFNNKISGESIQDIIKYSELGNVESFNLSYNNIDGKYIENIAKTQSLKLKTNRVKKFKLHLGECQKFYNLLMESYANNQDSSNLDKDNIKKVIFKTAEYDRNGHVVEYMLANPHKYPFLINSQDEQGHTLSHFYTHSPNMQKFLFEHGMIPKPEPEKDTALQDIIRDNQSVHNTPVVKKTNFIVKELVESIKVNHDRLKQAADSYSADILKLLQQYKDNPIKTKLLCITENEKRSVMEQVLSKTDPIPDDKKFVQVVIEKALQALETQYLRKKEETGEYDDGYPTAELQYDYTKNDAKVTIPQSMGYTQLLIDRFDIPLNERKELLVTLAEQNPELIEQEQKLSNIKSELKNNNITQEQITNRTEFFKLLENVESSKIDKLFKEISGLDIEETWREQKRFVLAKQIYIAATAYGNEKDSSACIQGVWSQIIAAVDEIDSVLVEKYNQYLTKEKEQEEQKKVITTQNIGEFEEALANTLIQYVKENSKLKEALDDFAVAGVDINSPGDITLEHQRILAKINQEFSSQIKKYLPNYGRDIPKRDEYKIIIEELSTIKKMELFSQEISPIDEPIVNKAKLDYITMESLPNNERER